MRPGRNAQRPSFCHTSQGAPETIPLNPKFLGGFLRVLCPSCVVPVVILLGDERAGKKRCSQFSRDRLFFLAFQGSERGFGGRLQAPCLKPDGETET